MRSLMMWFDSPVGRAKFVANTWFVRLKWFILQVLVVVVLVAALLWMSVFFYGSFYYAYMPTVSHERPVHLLFRTDCGKYESLCSFPSANLSLLRNERELLVRGQAYVVKLDLEMPESGVNRELGMFMVQVQFYTRYGELVYMSSRSAMMRYKSLLYRTIETLFVIPSFFMPSFLVGSTPQKQMVTVELTNNHQEDPYKPSHGVVVEVQSKRIEIYNASLKIHATFSGLRYLLFYWPTLSAVFGIGTNFFFLSVIALFSWASYASRTASQIWSDAGSRSEAISAKKLDYDGHQVSEEKTNGSKLPSESTTLFPDILPDRLSSVPANRVNERNRVNPGNRVNPENRVNLGNRMKLENITSTSLETSGTDISEQTVRQRIQRKDDDVN